MLHTCDQPWEDKSQPSPPLLQTLLAGPNPALTPVGGYHWFDGDGMLHGVRIKDGRASYANHFVSVPGITPLPATCTHMRVLHTACLHCTDACSCLAVHCLSSHMYVPPTRPISPGADGAAGAGAGRRAAAVHEGVRAVRPERCMQGLGRTHQQRHNITHISLQTIFVRVCRS